MQCLYWADDILLAGYNNWEPGEPNIVAEKCGHIIGTGPAKGKWNDLSCTRQSDSSAKDTHVVLCQKKAKHKCFVVVFVLSGSKIIKRIMSYGPVVFCCV